MLKYVAKRVAATVPVMGFVALFVFSLLYLAPGDPAVLMAGDNATPAEVEQVRINLGLDQPFLTRFKSWAVGVLHGDLGKSIFTEMPVSMLIAQRIGPTLSLMVVTILISVPLGIGLGVLAAWKAGSRADHVVGFLTVLGFSMPVFVVGYLLAYVFATELGWLPVQGYSPLADGFVPWLKGLLLPAIVLSFIYTALIARVARTAMLEVLGQDFIRTARGKGLGTAPILFIHALKNAAVPIVTVVGTGVAILVGGAVATESVFAIPGLGRLTIDAILRRDYPVIQGVILLFSFSYVAINLLVDISYSLLDPRIRY